MKLHIRNDRMEEIQDLQSAYPYAFHAVDMEATAVPWHWHEAMEFGYVREGTVQVSTANQTLTFCKGEGFFINSNILTAMGNDSRCFLESHLFHPVFLGGHFKSVFETKYLNPVLQNRNLEIFPVRGENQNQKQMLGKLRQLARLQDARDMEFQTRNLLSEIWLLLLEELKQPHNQPAPSKNQDRILTMLAFLHAHYGEKITLEEIAQAAAVSTRECLRCFREAIDQSPMEYLIAYRIRSARKLLENTDLPVTEVALRCGFNSASYFTKQFRSICGITPNMCRGKR